MEEKKNRYRSGSEGSACSKLLFCCLFAILFLALSPLGFQIGHAAQVTLSWDPNAETDLAGYKVSYGKASGNYDTTVDVGKITGCTLDGLQEGTTYYFAAKAYNTASLESGYSNEVSYSAPVPPESYTLATTCGANGSISPSGTVSAVSGASQTFTMTPNAGYQVASVVVDGVTVGTSPSYTFSNITANHTLAATFSPVTKYTITTSRNSFGSISPSGTVSVSAGASQTFTFTPKTGYRISSVTVDGSSVGRPASYTFNNVTSNHSIKVLFTKQYRLP